MNKGKLRVLGSLEEVKVTSVVLGVVDDPWGNEDQSKIMRKQYFATK